MLQKLINFNKCEITALLKKKLTKTTTIKAIPIS